MLFLLLEQVAAISHLFVCFKFCHSTQKQTNKLKLGISIYF